MTILAKTLSVVCEKQDRQIQSQLSIPASWASGASSEAGWLACMSAPVGPDPKTGAGPWAAWAEEGVAGVDMGVVTGVASGLVVGSAAGAADSDAVAPVTCTSGKASLDLLSIPARSTPQINMSHMHSFVCQEGREGKGGEGKGREGKGREWKGGGRRRKRLRLSASI